MQSSVLQLQIAIQRQVPL